MRPTHFGGSQQMRPKAAALPYDLHSHVTICSRPWNSACSTQAWGLLVARGKRRVTQLVTRPSVDHTSMAESTHRLFLVFLLPLLINTYSYLHFLAALFVCFIQGWLSVSACMPMSYPGYQILVLGLT